MTAVFLHWCVVSAVIHSFNKLFGGTLYQAEGDGWERIGLSGGRTDMVLALLQLKCFEKRGEMGIGRQHKSATKKVVSNVD